MISFVCSGGGGGVGDGVGARDLGGGSGREGIGGGAMWWRWEREGEEVARREGLDGDVGVGSR